MDTGYKQAIHRRANLVTYKYIKRLFEFKSGQKMQIEVIMSYYFLPIRLENLNNTYYTEEVKKRLFSYIGGRTATSLAFFGK